MLEAIARLAVRWRLAIIGFWLAISLVLFLLAPRLADVAAYSSQGFLPETAPSKQAEAVLARITKPVSGQTSLIITLAREGGLSPEDEQAGQAIVRSLEGLAGQDGAVWPVVSVQHPWKGPDWRKQLFAANGRTALIVVNLADPAYASSLRGAVSGLRSWLAATPAAAADWPPAPGLPPGLQANLTGEAAFSYDEHELVSRSMDTITQITIVVVLLVLLLVFRSPLAPLLPLSVVGLSFLIARSLIALLSLLGFTVSSYTETFLIAVLFGAGTDYCLLLISRYREELRRGLPMDEALQVAQRWSIPAILSSGGTVVVGFLCMGLAGFGLFNTTGPSVAIGVGIAILMVLTLTPALLSLFGMAVFWPGKPVGVLGADPLATRGRLWDKLAVTVTRRPIPILLISLAVFAPAVWHSLGTNRSFDQLSELPPVTDSIVGFERITADFAIGETMPLRLVVQSGRNLWNNRALQAQHALAQAMAAQDGVSKVRGATQPGGERIDQLGIPDADPQAPFNLPKLVIAANPELKDAMTMFMSEDGKQFYLDVILEDPPYRHEALDRIALLREAAQAQLAGSYIDDATVGVAGASAMFADVREITARDFGTVMALVLAGILVVLVLLLRSLVAPLYLLLTIIGSWAVTLGITRLVFEGLLGYEGVNWAVPFFSFCVLVALGVDYNIFLMSRVREEYRPGHNTRAVAISLAETGKVITSCGVIMAGTFAAMMVSPVRSIVEVGFATVLGLLIDTFLIRTLVVPAVATLVGEWNWWPRKR